MNRDYKRLFKLNVLHEYYSNLNCNDLSFIPTPDCKRKLAGLNLTITDQDNGFEVLFPQTTSGGPPLIQIPDNTQLTFLISLRNNYFYNFSSIPQKRGFVFYFSNRKSTNKGNIIAIDLNKFPQGNYLYSYHVDRQQLVHELSIEKETSLTPHLFGFLNIFLDGIKTLPRVNLALESKKIIWKYRLFLSSDSKETSFNILNNQRIGNNRYKEFTFDFAKTEETKTENGSRSILFSSVKEYHIGVFDASGNEVFGEEIPSVIKNPKQIAVPVFDPQNVHSDKDLFLKRKDKETIHDQAYGYIKLSEYSELHISASSISIDKLVLEKESKIIFKQDCKVSIKSYLKMEHESRFNTTGKNVLCMVGVKRLSESSKVIIHSGVHFTATLFTFGTLEFKSDNHHHHHHHDHHDHHHDNEETHMTGIFIVNNVQNGKNIIWTLRRNTWGTAEGSEREPQKIPFYEENKSQLQLISHPNQSSENESDGYSINNGSQELIIIENLPNPSIKRINPEVLIHL